MGSNEKRTMKVTRLKVTVILVLWALTSVSVSEGDENCQCLNWRDCRWSNAAVYSIKDVAIERDEFKLVQTMLRQNTCGDDPENHFVNCCGPDQKPSEIHHSIDEPVSTITTLEAATTTASTTTITTTATYN